MSLNRLSFNLLFYLFPFRRSPRTPDPFISWDPWGNFKRETDLWPSRYRGFRRTRYTKDDPIYLTLTDSQTLLTTPLSPSLFNNLSNGDSFSEKSSGSFTSHLLFGLSTQGVFTLLLEYTDPLSPFDLFPSIVNSSVI